MSVDLAALRARIESGDGRAGDAAELAAWAIADEAASVSRQERLAHEMLEARVALVHARGLDTADKMAGAAAELADLANDLTRLSRGADTPGAEGEPADTGDAPRPGIRFMSGPDFMAAGGTEPAVLVPRIAVEGCITMPHGRPRSLKTLAELVGFVEVSAGLPWWGVYPVARPLRVGLVLEEDGAKLIRQRLGLILAGLGLDELPEDFSIMVRSGINLEAPSERREFLEGAVLPQKLDVLLLDPTRSPFPGVDGGPEKGAPLRRFAREALELVPAVHLIHHDIKPARDGQDVRARAEQASGGQILSVADIPMGFSRLGGRSTLVEWSLVKVGADGPPLRLDFESGTAEDGGFAEYLRVTATEAGDEDTQDAGNRERVRAWVLDNPWKTAPEIATGTSLKRETVDRLLDHLAGAKLLRLETGAGAKARNRHKNARLWGPFDE